MPIRRRVFLLNKTFQLRFSFYVCSWLIALSMAYPLIISNLFDYLIRYLSLDPLGPTLAGLEKAREDVLWLLVTMQVVLIGLTFILSIFMSHKIAGPLYKLRRFFREAKDGNIEQKLSFRKRDYFTELVPEYNEMMTSIRKRFSKRSAAAQVAITRIQKALPNANPESKKDLEAALKALQEAEMGES